MIFVFPAFTLNPFFSIASFQVKSLMTHSSSDSAMMSLAYRSSQGTPEWNSYDKASSTMMKSSGLSTEPWWTLTFRLFTVPLTNMDTAPCICIHPLHQSHNPLLHTKFSQHPIEDLPRYSIICLHQVYKSHCSLLLAARYFSCSCLTTKIASVVPLPGTKPNWEWSTDTNCLMRPSTNLSRTFMTCSVSLRQW